MTFICPLGRATRSGALRKKHYAFQPSRSEGGGGGRIDVVGRVSVFIQLVCFLYNPMHLDREHQQRQDGV
jgi:hypothetical protein